MREVYDLIDRANEVQISLWDIVFKVKDGESDMRGFVITHKESYYTSFRANKSYARQKTQELQAFVTDSQQVANCVILRQLVAERFATLDKLGNISDTLYIAEFQQIVEQGERISERIEAHINFMLEYQRTYLTEYERRLFSLMDTRRRVSILGSVLAMVLAVFIFRLIRKDSELVQKRQELLQELNANKDKFFSIISHDLKNPFTAIKGFIEMLNHEEYRRKTEDVDEIAKRLKSSSERFEKLLNDLLTWARLQMNTVTVEKELVNITDMLHTLPDQYASLADAKELKFEVQSTMPTYALADRSMTETILRNLISNAIKFTDAGKITLSAYLEADSAVVEVSDTGVGMDASTLQNLFQPGKIQSRRGTRNETGTGMGLILCKDMAIRQGGDLVVNSTRGQGTSIQLYLTKGGHGTIS